MSAKRPNETFEARFWAKVDQRGDDGCWPWMAAVTHSYGVIGRGGRGRGNILAHRAAYELLVGPIPDGLHIHHRCENQLCCNPAHMEPILSGPHALLGTGPPALNARKTHCKRGHPLAGDNLALYEGSRQCKTCQRARAQRQRDILKIRRQHERSERAA